MANTMGRIALTRDTTANWDSKRDFIPMRGEVIVYMDAGHKSDGNGGTINVPRFKVGDGQAYLIDLPFVGEDANVTPEDIAFWNNKLNCTLAGEILIFNRD